MGRGSDLFLNYLRDGKVSLPLIESKEALLADLVYYGVENVDEGCIDEPQTKAAHAARRHDHRKGGHSTLSETRDTGGFKYLLRLFQ